MKADALVIDAIRGLQGVTDDRSIVVALDGHSGAGKSTLATTLADTVTAAVVHVDDFYRDMPDVERRELSPARGVDRYFDWQRLREEALVPLERRERAQFRRFNWSAGGGLTSAVTVEPRDIVIIEGLDRNSYNSGDWFNRIDWSMKDSTWGSGLPPARDNEAKWPFMRPLLADRALEPTAADISAAADRADELLRIASSSALFRLGTAAEIQDRVGFPQGGPYQTPGVVVMTLDDSTGTDLDPRWERLVVVFNASAQPTTQTLPGQAGRSFALHPVQTGGRDPVVRTAVYHAGTGAFTVPARSVAVFVS